MLKIRQISVKTKDLLFRGATAGKAALQLYLAHRDGHSVGSCQKIDPQ